jgi:pimeloyl-ACP methyl ester carboxylesterase
MVLLHGVRVPMYVWSGPETRADLAPILLIHGYMDAARTWDRVAPLLVESGRRVLAFDLRGYGDGLRVAQGCYYHFPDYILDVVALLDAARIEKVALVGHSMGGVVATLFAGSFPERAERLVLIEGLGPPDHLPGSAPARMRAFVEGSKRAWVKAAQGPPQSFGEAHALSRLKLNHPLLEDALLQSRLPHLAKEEVPGAFTWRFDALHRTRSPMPFFASMFCEFARAVTAKVLFVSGGVSGFHPSDEATRLAAFQTLEIQTIERAGHMVHWTEPEALARTICPFLRAPTEIPASA